MTTAELANITQAMLPTIRDAGTYIMGHLYQHENNAFQIKGRQNIVSLVDREVEIKIVEKAKELLPEATFLTEEQTVDNKKSNVRWIIDPLDGTTNFYYKIPLFAVSVALEVNNTIAIGIVYDVTNDDMYYCWKNGGAFINGQPISCSHINNIKEAFVATGIPNDYYPQINNYLAALENIIYNTRGIRRLGSAALEMAYVAAGKFDAFFEHGLSPWDIAAGLLLIEEAGGTVSDFFGESDNMEERKSIVAAAPGIHTTFCEIVGSCFNKFN